MKPLIGITPSWDSEHRRTNMGAAYCDNVITSGGIPVILPITDNADALAEMVRHLDGVLFSGGPDVVPEMYGETKLYDAVYCSPIRDTMETAVFNAAMELEKPILGICRGIQFLNVAMGGTLYQDLPSQHPSDTAHRQSTPGDQTSHYVIIQKDTPLYDLLGADRLAVNSFHHQAVRTLAPGLSAMAVSEDGITEALYRPGKQYFRAVQWHPEALYSVDIAAKKIFDDFVAAASE